MAEPKLFNCTFCVMVEKSDFISKLIILDHV